MLPQFVYVCPVISDWVEPRHMWVYLSANLCVLMCVCVSIFLCVFLCIILGDQIGAFLKDFFQEPRPCFQYSVQLIDLGIIKNQCGERLTGMPSNHALNFFLFSTLIYLITKRKILGFCLFIISSTVGLSRVFLAKHLLSQVIIGASLGILLGIVFYNILKKFKWIQK